MPEIPTADHNRIFKRLYMPILLSSIAVAMVAAAVAWVNLRPIGPDSNEVIARLKSNTPPGMALVPAGPFLIGSDDADADDENHPRRIQSIPAFYIDLHEVTNREFQKFDPSHLVPPGEENLPAGSITYAQAEAYAKWAGKRLPTEAEWEKAARGADGRRYPWGDTWDPKRVAPRRKRPGDRALQTVIVDGKKCAVGPSRLQPVGSLPSEKSPYGCLDMAGNAWEWVQGYFNGNPKQRILRGGAIGYGERACRTYITSVEGAEDT